MKKLRRLFRNVRSDDLLEFVVSARFAALYVLACALALLLWG